MAGDQVYLAGEGSLAAGVYTLLPARYALLPGAFLVTPTGAQPEGNQTEPDGSYLVSGYEFNAFQSARTAQPLLESFQVDSSEVINNSAQYNVSLGNVFLASGAASSGATVPRLPLDAGQLVFNATQTMSVEGSLESQAGSGGSGGLVDINSPSNIVITGAGSSSSAPNTLTLNASELSSFGAASLLIGGSRDLTGGDSATVTVSTDSITVDNGSEALEGADIILVSNDSITVDQGAVIESFGGAGTAEALTVDGNGTLLRVSSDEDAPVTRTGNTVTAGPELTVDSGAKITAGSATFDSSAGMSLDPNAVFNVKSIALDSSQITLELTNPGVVPPSTGLVLSGNALNGIFANAESVSLLSYGSLDIYGTGSLGSVSSTGVAQLKELEIHAGELSGFNNGGGNVAFNAQDILLDNVADDSGALGPSVAGTLQFNAGKIELGSNQLNIDQFSTVELNATGGVMAVGTAGSPLPAR